jgi:hypothetical protein
MANKGQSVVDITSSERAVVCANIIARDFPTHKAAILAETKKMEEEGSLEGGAINDAIREAFSKSAECITSTNDSIIALSRGLDHNLAFKIDMDDHKYDSIVDEMNAQAKKAGILKKE